MPGEGVFFLRINPGNAVKKRCGKKKNRKKSYTIIYFRIRSTHDEGMSEDAKFIELFAGSAFRARDTTTAAQRFSILYRVFVFRTLVLN